MREENKQYSLSNNDESNLYSFHLTLFSDTVIVNDLWVPKTPEGFIKFSNIPQYNFLNIVAKDNKWYAVCQQPAFFKDVPISESCESGLNDGKLLKISKNDIEFLLLIEKAIPERNVFHNYSICSDVEIKIGNQSDCEIYYDGPFVSKQHAVILRRKDQWFIKCLDSLYGIYVNCERTNAAQLQLGDIVYLMGLKIIIGQGFLSINSGLGHIQINPRIIQEEVSQWASYYHYNEISTDSSDKYFTPAPRKRRESEETVITVDGPPMSINQAQMPLMLRMGSSMVMGGAAALSGNFMTLITSVLFPFLSSKYSDEQRKKYEELRNTKYTEYLQKKQSEIQDAITCEQVGLNQKFPHLSKAISDNRLLQHLWERRVCDSDFLQLRIGTGKRSLSAKIEYPIKGFQLESDALEDKMYQLVEKKYILEDAPILLSLVNTYICGIQGQKAEIIRFIETLILQIAMYHSYDEVKMMFLGDYEDIESLEPVKYLPHSWDDMRSIRFVATNEVEAFTVGEYIKGQLEGEADENTDLTKLLKKRPYYIIFALNKKTFDGHEIFKDILSKDKNPGVSIITAYGSLPKECQQIITLNHDSQNISTTMGIDGGDDESFATDRILKTQTNQVFHTISNISLKKVTQAQAMPKMVTFLDMFNVGRIEQLNPLKRWAENNPIKSLAAPVGVGEDGLPFMLDLHEKRQGPHGLVAGMTGSGKSEFLITYILSMAVNYHPDEVAFVLIDYKGGGLASAFDNPRTGIRLPHLVGTITNLDGSSINRSLFSIESELLRRQREFNKATKATNEGTMNIYTYQKLYRAGKVDKPMPHLFIISDEFAELKQQQPEFMDKLISAARIGRSLGVHLILATQKPSGVVNEQIRSNTKFQVCLRVQERSDSMDMIKRPDAAELTDTGRFYLQVGYNEYFALGQSAWCGADYEPKDVVTIPRDDAIEFIDITGQVTSSKKPAIRKTSSGMKQIVAVVEYLDLLAKNMNYKSTPLWRPELPTSLDTEDIKKSYSVEGSPMSVAIGLVDDPELQQQYPLHVNFETCGNMIIVGESGSGKTTTLQNIIYSLCEQLSPKDFNFYGLDYSSRMFKQFQRLPHCGAILLDEDALKLDEFFKLINKETARRKKLFTELEVDNFSEARKKEQLPLIVVFVDNFAGLTTTKIGENHNYQFSRYLKDSFVYGIKYIITGTSLRDIPSKLRQEFEENICLHMRDKYDYSEALGCKISCSVSDVPGRGLCKIAERALCLQISMLCAKQKGEDRTETIKQKIASLTSSYTEQYNVQHMPVIDSTAEFIDFANQFEPGRIPLGYARTSGKPVALPFKQFKTLAVYFGNLQGTKVILNNFLYSFQRENMEIWIVKRKTGSLFDDNNPDGISVSELKNTDCIDCNQESLRTLQKALINTEKDRKKQKSEKDFSHTTQRKEQPKILLLIESAEDFSSELNEIALFSYHEFFSRLYKSDIYVLACFEPQETKNTKLESVAESFSDKDILLFGGQYDKQQLYNLKNLSGGSNLKQFNEALMIYRSEMHPVLMPCGNIKTEKPDPDLESIF